MAVIALVAVAIATFCSGDARALAAFSGLTALALLVAVLAARFGKREVAAFAFGFAVFGGSYYATLAPWTWELDRGRLGVGVPPGWPMSPLLDAIVERFVGPNPVRLYEHSLTNLTVIDLWFQRRMLGLGTLHLSTVWVLGACGGLLACLASRWGETDGRPQEASP